MKALTLQQPYASDLADGYCLGEGRSWRTKYRGPVLICAAKTKHKDYLTGKVYPAGVALAVAQLADIEGEEGSYVWSFSEVRPIKPFPVKGKLGLFEVAIKPEDIEYTGECYTEERDNPNEKLAPAAGPVMKYTW